MISNNVESLYADVQLCESCDNYENPWHVDTRKRYVHMLIYFGNDEIEEGGEIGIAKHKELSSLGYEDVPEFAYDMCAQRHEYLQRFDADLKIILDNDQHPDSNIIFSL